MIKKKDILNKLKNFNNSYFQRYKYGFYMPLNREYHIREKYGYLCETKIKRETQKAILISIKVYFKGISQKLEYWLPKSATWKEKNILCIQDWLVKEKNIQFGYKDQYFRN